MRAGQVVENGPTADVLSHPRSSYTRALLDAAPVPDPVAQRLRHARQDQEPALSR
jgi:peptide/nickel transport system ATP-binding protein